MGLSGIPAAVIAGSPVGPALAVAVVEASAAVALEVVTWMVERPLLGLAATIWA